MLRVVSALASVVFLPPGLNQKKKGKASGPGWLPLVSEYREEKAMGTL